MENEAPQINLDIDVTESAAPIALLRGEPLLKLPADLYIPPEALEIFLEHFHGPLDLLLYLIRKQNLDILDIPIARITQQYIEYVQLMKQLNLELAADYLVMAATLAEIKSRFLLPKPPNAPEEVEDPRAELVRRLQAYERIKAAAVALDELPRHDRDLFLAHAASDNCLAPKTYPPLLLEDLLNALKDVFERASQRRNYQIRPEPLSVRERMSRVLQRLQSSDFFTFGSLFTIEEGRSGVVVTFIALLELWKQTLIEIVQAEPGAMIYVRTLQKKRVLAEMPAEIGEPL